MSVRILVGDVREQLRTLPDESVQCIVTSPPYWGLRDYGVDGQIGLEATPQEFVAVMVDVFREVRRVLRADGTCWVNTASASNSIRPTPTWPGDGLSATRPCCPRSPDVQPEGSPIHGQPTGARAPCGRGNAAGAVRRAAPGQRAHAPGAARADARVFRAAGGGAEGAGVTYHWCHALC